MWLRHTELDAQGEVKMQVWEGICTYENAPTEAEAHESLVFMELSNPVLVPSLFGFVEDVSHCARHTRETNCDL